MDRTLTHLFLAAEVRERIAADSNRTSGFGGLFSQKIADLVKPVDADVTRHLDASTWWHDEAGDSTAGIVIRMRDAAEKIADRFINPRTRTVTLPAGWVPGESFEGPIVSTERLGVLTRQDTWLQWDFAEGDSNPLKVEPGTSLVIPVTPKMVARIDAVQVAKEDKAASGFDPKDFESLFGRPAGKSD